MTPALQLMLMSEKLIGTKRRPDYYVNQLIKFMIDEWLTLRLKMADLIVDSYLIPSSVNESLLNEELFIPAGRANLMYKSIRTVLKQYKDSVYALSWDLVRKAKLDAAPKLTATKTTVLLSTEGLQEVISSLQWQRNFVDDYSKDVEARVKAIVKGRYSTKLDVRRQINRTFRIDRDLTINKFHKAVDSLAGKVRDGSISPDQFKSMMQQEIDKHYRLLYQEGKGTTSLEKWEDEFIKGQANGQEQYLDNFRRELTMRKGLGQELTGRVNWRANLYAERGSAVFEAGHVGSLPDDVLLTWKMHPAEHCSTCPVYEANSPYTKQSLPGYPGEGFHLTQCGTNCKCSIQISDLYVTAFPDAPEESLAVRVTRDDTKVTSGRISKKDAVAKGSKAKNSPDLTNVKRKATRALNRSRR